MKILRCMLCVIALGVIVLLTPSRTLAEDPATAADQLSTAEHVRKSNWWPTKGTPARDAYAGPQACARCHSSFAVTQKDTLMGRDSTRAADSELLNQNRAIHFQSGPYNYEITHTAGGKTYSVSDGTRTISETLDWAVGSGNRGQSYLFRYKGTFYEAHLSFYRSTSNFDITPDHSRLPAGSLEKAIGRPILSDEATKCFSCHTTASTVGGQFEPAHSIPGITCEACHGPGAVHAETEKAGIDAGVGSVLNPKHFTPAESVDFCGSCHRTWWDVVLGGTAGAGVANVRFPIYRLEKSRCWGKGDSRITCVACHDPHLPLVKEASGYDRQCLSCHNAGMDAKLTREHPGKTCPLGKKDCATCHMPKYDVTDMQSTFTDHMIRVVRPNAPFPD